MSGASTEFLRIARVLKSYGTEGEILAGFRDVDPEDLNLEEPVFIMLDGLPVPFFIDSFKSKGTSKALLRLTGIKNLKDSEEIVGADIFVRPETVEGEEDGELSLEDLVGWSLLDEEYKEVGTITGFEPIPGNPCLYVETQDGSTAMVPLHDDLVIDIDEEALRITMMIPEGLL